MPDRQPTGFANYPGNVVVAIHRDVKSGRPFGPNYMGEQMWPVSAEYDMAANQTRVGFSLIAPSEVSA